MKNLKGIFKKSINTILSITRLSNDFKKDNENKIQTEEEKIKNEKNIKEKNLKKENEKKKLSFLVFNKFKINFFLFFNFFFYSALSRRYFYCILEYNFNNVFNFYRDFYSFFCLYN